MLALLISATADAPDPNKVVAGWTAFWIFIVLIAAVALLCWSFVRQLRKADAAKEAGILVSGKDPQPRASDDDA